MSADVINAKDELPVWTVHGINWHLDVPMNEYNAQFDKEIQAYEAASQAIWTFKGNDNGLFIVMDNEETVPLLASTMIVHLKGTDPNKGYIPFTYLILANQGFYADATKMQALLHADLEAIKQDQIKNEHAQIQIQEELKKLKKNLFPPTQ